MHKNPQAFPDLRIFSCIILPFRYKFQRFLKRIHAGIVTALFVFAPIVFEKFDPGQFFSMKAPAASLDKGFLRYLSYKN